jgi:hypothetical protein
VKDVPLLPSPNYFDVLTVEEIYNTSPKNTDPSSTTTRATSSQKLKIKNRLLTKLKIGAAELGPNSLYLQAEIESTDTQWKQAVRALVDSGATGLFIDSEYIKWNQILTKKLAQPIPMYNIDGSANMDGSIMEVAELLLQYNGHTERALFCVTRLGKPHPWTHLVEGQK